MAVSTAGFDYLRLVLATGVMVFHSYTLQFSPSVPTPPLIRAAAALMVPGFFAVSGFLVAQSVERHRIAAYFSLRALRLAPALIVVSVITALVIKPGAFASLPIKAVNGSLWTISYEVLSYVLLAASSLFMFKRPAVFVALLGSAFLVFLSVHYARGWPPAILGDGLVLTFGLGVALYLYRARVVHSWRLAWGGLALAYALNAAGMMPLALPFAAYAVVSLGMIPARRLRADYSYGIYVAAFPIQQTLILFGATTWWSNLALALPLTLIYAAASWHLVERPALGLRGRLAGLGRTGDIGMPNGKVRGETVLVR